MGQQHLDRVTGAPEEDDPGRQLRHGSRVGEDARWRCDRAVIPDAPTCARSVIAWCASWRLAPDKAPSVAGDRWLRNGRAHRAFISPLMDRRFELDRLPSAGTQARVARQPRRCTWSDHRRAHDRARRSRPRRWRGHESARRNRVGVLPLRRWPASRSSSQRPRDSHARPCGQRRPSQPPILAAGGGSPVIRSVDRSTVQLGCLRPLRARRTIGADARCPQHGCPRVRGSLRGTRPHLRPGCGRAVDDPRNPSERNGGRACSTRVPRPSAAPTAGTR